MITNINNSIFRKPIAVRLSLSFLLMSFTSGGKSGVGLKAGTNINLETVSTIQSDMVIVGQIVEFRVKSDVKVDDKVGIAAGAIAKGQVVRGQKAKALGKEGFVEIQIKSVRAVDGQEVYLSGGNVYQEGDDQQTLAIVLGVFVCILFLFLKGKNAMVPAGFQLSSSVASTVTINT